MKDNYTGWAIDSRSDEGHSLIGRFWWVDGWPPKIPAHMLGHKIALFETREKARLSLQRVRLTWPKARIVKVEVILKEQS